MGQLEEGSGGAILLPDHPASEAPAPPPGRHRLTPAEELVATAAGVRWPMTRDSLDPMSLPYHEAGHTIIGLVLKRRLSYVSVEPGDQMSDFEVPDGTDAAWVEGWIKTALGGPLAEQRRFGVSWGCKTDIACIRDEIAKNLAGVEEIGFVARVAKDVASLLEIHGEALDMLANELVLKQRLTGDEVARLITIE